MVSQRVNESKCQWYRQSYLESDETDCWGRRFPQEPVACRQFAGTFDRSEVSTCSLFMINSILMLNSFRVFLDKFPFVVASAVYTYLRLIEDHLNPVHAVLRQKEVNFCITMLREKFNDCMTIGRDLVRLLHNVARIPEFELVWKDILHNPKALSPSFTGKRPLLFESKYLH